MDFIEITIRSWDKYNARKDIKRPWWFKLSNNILEDPDLYELKAEELKAWIYILSQCSKQQNKHVRIMFDHARRSCDVNISCLKTCIQKLKEKHILEESVRDPALIRTRSGQQTREEEIREEKNNTIAQPLVNTRCNLDFESLYSEYPKKLGKKRGLTICKSTIKTPEALLAARKAVKRYADYCRSNKTEPRYILYFSTFMNSWEDWLDESTGKSEKYTGVMTITEILAKRKREEEDERGRVRENNVDA